MTSVFWQLSIKKAPTSLNGVWMMENLFKRVNYVIPLRYLNMFLNNREPENIIFNLTPHILISDSPLKSDLSIFAIVK